MKDIMERIKVSKNLYLGEKIEDVRELLKLAEEKKSVAFKIGLTQQWMVRPAACIIHWSLRMITLREFYKTEII
jgi:hypothetical protein